MKKRTGPTGSLPDGALTCICGCYNDSRKCSRQDSRTESGLFLMQRCLKQRFQIL